MKVEIDVSEVEYGAHYKDEKCRELERILQSDSKYAECEVKRVHWNDESTDPFDVLDEDEESIVLLETWEVNTLSAPEILAYIEVKQIQDKLSPDTELFQYGSFIAFGLAAGGLSAIVILEEATKPLTSWLVPLYTLTLILGIISGRTYRKSILQKKNADLEAARKDSSFPDMLRRLAQVPEADEYTRKKLLKRVKIIEDELAGVNS